MRDDNRKFMVEVRPVRSAAERRTFLLFPWRIYRGDPLWVPPLLPERAARIDPKRGTFFRRGEAEFFIAWRGKRPVGTICAAEDRAVNAQRGLRDCMFGFFECVNDYDVACALFERAADWGRRRGLETLYGPFNLDYEDSYGILVEGRDRPPALLCGHTPPYYLDFVERYGFQPARGDNIAFAIDIDEDNENLRRLKRVAERLRQRGGITIRGARLDRWDEEVDAVLYLLNTATAHLVDFIPWQREALEETLAAFRKIADPELILFAEVGGRPVGWFPALPNLNEIFQHVNGLRYPWDYLKLAWYMRRRQPKCLTIKSVLVLPEYWNTGVSLLLFDEMARRVQGKGYEWADLSLTSADNPATPGLAERMGARIYKRYRVYRLPFK
jgi:GNAT superfamily N-acetyltransferase